MEYRVHEANWNRLVKTVASIKKKAEKIGCSITFEHKGDDYVTDNNGNVTRYYLVEAEGEAKYNGFAFAGTIQHTAGGNIIRRINAEGGATPARFRTCNPWCEHCKSIRSRKDTYMVVSENGEWLQIGKTCLKAYTGGLDVSHASLLAQYVEEMEDCSNPPEDWRSLDNSKYVQLADILCYAVSAIRLLGYQKTSETLSTKDRVLGWRRVITRQDRESDDGWREEIRDHQLTNDRIQNNINTVKNAIDWAKAQSGSEYLENIATIAKMEYIEHRDLGMAVSIISSYFRYLEREAERARREENAKRETESSGFFGNPGDKIQLNVASITCVASYDGYYGTSCIWKILDDAGNVFVWKTSTFVDPDKVKHLRGTIKDHKEFRGVKQTELTRCKIV